MLTLVPTPLGNLSDISFRILETFSKTDIFFCEDTRVTKHLLALLKQRLGLEIPSNVRFVSFHSHNAEERLAEYKHLLETRRCVYVSDAGMPGISDPGRELVSFCRQNGIAYDVIPGPSAVTVAYAASGFDSGHFLFRAFLPHKGKERKEALLSVLQSGYDTVLYEAPHRLLKLLEEIVSYDEQRELFLAKEISKAHQRYYRGAATELLKQLSQETIRGEWCVVIRGKCDSTQPVLHMHEIEAMDLPPKIKAKLLAKMTGEPVKVWYGRLGRT